MRENDYVLAARSVGVPKRTILAAHILPNALSPIVVVASLIVAGNIIGEAFVSFLGFGVQPPAPEIVLAAMAARTASPSSA